MSTNPELNSHELNTHIELLVRAWGLVADVGFCDLLLVRRRATTDQWRVVAQVRPTTHQTLYADDLVGSVVSADVRPSLDQDWVGRHWADANVYAVGSSSPARSRAIPVRMPADRGGEDHPELMLLCEAALDAGRRRGRLETAYVAIFDQLSSMISAGRFPFPEQYEPAESLRVGDGVMVLDPQGRVRFASPNATSALHRLGVQINAEGKQLDELGLTADWLPLVPQTRLPLSGDLHAIPVSRVSSRGLLSGQGVTAGGATVLDSYGSSPRSISGGSVEFEAADKASPVVAVYLLPLDEGSLMLMRDVTDVRRRDRLLRSKDATIREVHHRVKNNLQTISSLLRLQGRRTGSPEARAAIEESVRRIRSMALVHETLSQGVSTAVPFNDVIRPLMRVVEEGLQESGTGRRVRFSVEGSAGELPAEIATPLSIVLVELLQNAVEHGYPADDGPPAKGESGGMVRVRFERHHDPEPQLRVIVRDDGCGFPPGFSLSSASGGASLGLTIVRTLVTSELDGLLSTYNDHPSRSERAGAVVEIRIPLRQNSSASR